MALLVCVLSMAMRSRFVIGAISGIASLLLCASALAEDKFAVRDVWFERQGDGYAVRADLQVGRRALFEHILHGGYTAELRFEMDFVQRRDWLYDSTVGNINWVALVTYDPLTRRYILGRGADLQRFVTLEALIESISRLRAAANNDEEYVDILRRGNVYLRARFSLSTNNLPVPVQIGFLIDGDWGGSGDWVTLPIKVSE